MANLNSKDASYIGIADAAGTLVDLKGDATGTIDIDDGYVTSEQTSAGDATVAYFQAKSDPELTIRFKPTTDAGLGAVDVLRGGGGERAFDLKFPDGGTNTGYHLAGTGLIEGPRRTYNIRERRHELEITIKPNGTAWTEDSDIA